jgi:dynein heavy chain
MLHKSPDMICNSDTNKQERPDLEEQKRMLMEQQNGFKVKLKELEDELLFRLATSQGDILADVELIDGLERAKITASDINAKALVAKETEAAIVESRKAYLPVSVRAALLYFLIDQMCVLDHMYRFSMANFVRIFNKGMDVADNPNAAKGTFASQNKEADPNASPAEILAARVNRLVETSCLTCFLYVAQALFERHKLIFACQLCFRTLQSVGELPADLFELLLRGTIEAGTDNPLSEWMDDKSWGAVQALKQFEPYERLQDDLIGSAKRFRYASTCTYRCLNRCRIAVVSLLYIYVSLSKHFCPIARRSYFSAVRT